MAQATWRAEGTGVPAKGLTGPAYEGHYFWDTEIYVLPLLSYTSPRIARNLLRFRSQHAAHGARARARARASAARSSRGGRSTAGRPRANYQAGTAQYHINADIAYAIRRYVNVRGDTGFLAEVGAEILVETARLWEDLGFYDDDGALPHPRRDRARRVHDRRQRQRLHEPHGPPEPRLRGVGGAPTRGRAARPTTPPWSPTSSCGPRRSKRGSGRRRRCTCPTTRRAASIRRTPPSWTARCGTSKARRASASRCCCTSTRWSSTASRWSSRPTSCSPCSCSATSSRASRRSATSTTTTR